MIMKKNIVTAIVVLIVAVGQSVYVHAVPPTNSTPLINAVSPAVRTGNLDNLKDIIKKGANVNEKDKNGRTALIVASRVPGLKPAASYNLGKRTKSFERATKVAQLLIDNHADVNAKDNNGATALMCAAEKGATALATLLIKNGADVHPKDKFGRTALDYAKGAKNAEIVKLVEAKLK